MEQIIEAFEAWLQDGTETHEEGKSFSDQMYEKWDDEYITVDTYAYSFLAGYKSRDAEIEALKAKVQFLQNQIKEIR